MNVKMILPALKETWSSWYRPIKYSLFPPLGLATLASHLSSLDDISIVDEHVERLCLNDDPDLVVIQCYITSARRSYQIADHYRSRGTYVAIGGLHPTSMPEEAGQHADTVFVGPGDHSFPGFLADFRRGEAKRCYNGRVRSLVDVPLPRRDLIKRERYLVPNSIVVSRGCPHHCDFCYKDGFYRGGRSFYTRCIDAVLSEIEALPGRHLYFLDDQLFANEPFARELFAEMRGMRRVWQAAGTVQSSLRDDLMNRAVDSGLRSLFIGFETLNESNLAMSHKSHNPRDAYEMAVRRLHSLGVMINGSFVFGLDHDDETVFDRTVEWTIENGVETATFHILTPYPGTRLYDRLRQEGRLLSRSWDSFDTRTAVFRPARMTPEALERGYWRAYEQYYRWASILQSARTKSHLVDRIRHIAYAGGWKKLEPVWQLLIRSGLLAVARPVLERVLDLCRRGPSGMMPDRPVLSMPWATDTKGKDRPAG